MDKGIVTKTGRYEETSAELARLGMQKQITYGDGLLRASAEHRSSFEFETYDLPLERNFFVSLQRQQSVRLASFKELITRLSDLMQ